MTALPNTTITIACPSSGVPPPLITWYKNGQLVVTKGRLSVDTDGSLIINQAKHFDSARFTCVATNLAGKDRATSVLTVIGM